jgi:hypothetical protein
LLDKEKAGPLRFDHPTGGNMGLLLTKVDEKRPSVQQPLSNGNVALPFVIPRS